MFLSRYDFAGDPTVLHATLSRVLDQLPPDDVQLSILVRTETGVSLYDACPDQETFERFTASDEFAAMLAEAGLAAPVITSLGDVLRTAINASAVPA
jgi:hypothetical protein